MSTTKALKPQKSPQKLTWDETLPLNRLRGRKDTSSREAHASGQLVHHPRGLYLNRGTCVVYDKDGFSTDVRSQRGAVRGTLRAKAMGYEIDGFGGPEDSYSWALVVRFAPGTSKEEKAYVDRRLNAIVPDVWPEMDGLAPDSAMKTGVERDLSGAATHPELIPSATPVRASARPRPEPPPPTASTRKTVARLREAPTPTNRSSRTSGIGIVGRVVQKARSGPDWGSSAWMTWPTPVDR